MGLLFALLSRKIPELRYGALGCGLLSLLTTLGTLAGTAGGWVMGIRQMQTAISNVDPSMKVALQAAGEAELMNLVYFGLGSCFVLGIPGLVLLMLPKMLDKTSASV